MIDAIFYACVALLMQIAAYFDTTYEAVNVWIFCVIWPAITIGLCALIVRQKQELNYLITELQNVADDEEKTNDTGPK